MHKVPVLVICFLKWFLPYTRCLLPTPTEVSKLLPLRTLYSWHLTLTFTPCFLHSSSNLSISCLLSTPLFLEMSLRVSSAYTLGRKRETCEQKAVHKMPWAIANFMLSATRTLFIFIIGVKRLIWVLRKSVWSDMLERRNSESRRRATCLQ